MLANGSRIAHYEVLSSLGAGGMGEVYRAHDTRIKRDVALKILPGAFAADPDRTRRFEQEAMAAGMLNHPNVLVVFDVGQHEGMPYIVSELLEGSTLRDHLTRRLPLKKITDFTLQIANGLAAAHEKNIVHRDLKPENIFILDDDRVKLLDFGLVKLLQPEIDEETTQRHGTSPGMVVGTAGYMSPEQVRGEVIDHRSDIFSLGVILHEMITGAQPFRRASSVETMNAILHDDAAPLPAETSAALKQRVLPRKSSALSRSVLDALASSTCDEDQPGMATRSEHARISKRDVLRHEEAPLALRGIPNVRIGPAAQVFAVHVLDVVTKRSEFRNKLDGQILIELDPHQKAGSSGTGKSSSAAAAAKAIAARTSSARSAGKLRKISSSLPPSARLARTVLSVTRVPRIVGAPLQI